jgi:hypothetical protein
MLFSVVQYVCLCRCVEIQRFGKHCSSSTTCSLVTSWGSSPLLRSANQIRHIPLAIYCEIRLPKNAQPIPIHPEHGNLKCAETLDNYQHSTLLIPESRSCTLKSSRENLRTRIWNALRTELSLIYLCANVTCYRNRWAVLFPSSALIWGKMYSTRDQTVRFAYVIRFFGEGKQTHVLCKPKI